METTIPIGVSIIQDDSALRRYKAFHQGEKLSYISQSWPDLHPGCLFSDIGVMAAMTTMAV